MTPSNAPGAARRRPRGRAGERCAPDATRARKKLWIFDFDLTLARLRPEVDWAGSRRELEPMLRKAGVPGGLFEQYPGGNLPLYDAVRTHLLGLAARNGRPAKILSPACVRQILKRASAIIEKHELQGVDRARPLAGAIELISALRASGAKVAVVTSNSSRTIRRWFGRHGLRGLANAIVGRDSFLALKPSPEMLLRALAVCRIRPEDAAFVGDTPSDLKAATALGIEFFAIAPDNSSREQLRAAGAQRTFRSPRALAAKLNLVQGPSSHREIGR